MNQYLINTKIKEKIHGIQTLIFHILTVKGKPTEVYAELGKLGGKRNWRQWSYSLKHIINITITNLQTKFRSLFCSRPAPSMTLGFDVLLQLVIAAITTLPCLSSAGCPWNENFATFSCSSFGIANPCSTVKQLGRMVGNIQKSNCQIKRNDAWMALQLHIH